MKFDQMHQTFGALTEEVRQCLDAQKVQTLQGQEAQVRALFDYCKALRNNSSKAWKAYWKAHQEWYTAAYEYAESALQPLLGHSDHPKVIALKTLQDFFAQGTMEVEEWPDEIVELNKSRIQMVGWVVATFIKTLLSEVDLPEATKFLRNLRTLPFRICEEVVVCYLITYDVGHYLS